MDPDPQSPTLRKIRPGDHRAVLQFWARQSETGTPLVEPLPGVPGRCLVTFLWRSAHPCRIEVVSPFKMDSTAPEYLVRLPHTDIWYRSYESRSDIRTEYFFTRQARPEPGAPAKRWVDFSRTLGPDPLNRWPFRYAVDPEVPEDIPQAGSVVSLPEAPQYTGRSPLLAVDLSRVELHRYPSRALGNERRLWLYRSPARKRPSSQPPNLLLVFDGLAYQTLIPLPALLDDLQRRGQVGPTYAVFIDSVSAEQRVRELACNPAFARFTAGEVLPWAERQFGVRFPASRTTTLGSSLGGLAAAYVAWRCPDRVGRVLSQSGVFAWTPEGEEPGWLVRQFVKSARGKTRFYLEAGLLETGRSDPSGTAPGILLSNRILRDVLRAKGYPLVHREFPGAHDYIWWGETVTPALRSLNRLP